MATKRDVTRRGFLSRTAGAVGAGAVGPYMLTSGALAKPGRPGANDRIVLGHIGVGGRGSGFVRADSAAICDVDEHHLAAAAKRVTGEPFLCKDFRRLLERDDIDAVTIGSPDHWHGIQAVQAMQAGKDVYVEKPASKTIAEGQSMVAAAERYGRVVQVGSQGRSTPAAYAACKFVRNGQIGAVKRVDCWHYENPVGDWTPDEPPPSYLDWDLWLGPARWVPYNRKRCHFNFRWFLDFGGGNIRDRGAHQMSVVLWLLDKDDTGPVSVEAAGTSPPDGMYDCPTRMDVTYEFKDPDWTLTWRQPGERKLDAPFGAVYTGTKDTLIVTGGDGGCDTEDKAKGYQVPAGGVQPYRSPGHFQDWLDCIRSRSKPIMNIEAGHRVATLCILGNIAYRLGRKLNWDPVAEDFIGDPEASRWLSHPGRGAWQL